MARLIDADELLEKYETYGNTSPIALTFIDDLNEMPTVEQKHGHWIEEKTETGRKVYCSNCKHSAPFICIADEHYGTRMHGEFEKTKHCPNCGAKMRGLKGTIKKGGE